MKCYSYVRVSSGKQVRGKDGKEKDGLRRQIENAEKWAQKHGYELSEESFFQDANKSAFHGENLKADSSLSAFLAACDRGDIPRGAILIVEALDRITRANITTAQKLFLSVLERGIEVVTLIDGRRFTLETANANPTELMLSILSFDAANKYSANLRYRVAESWKKKRETGAKTKNVHPSWIRFDRKNDRFEIIDDKAAVVRTIFRLYLEGLGYAAIARRLNEDGIRTLTEKGAWSSGSVKVLLRSPLVIGEYHAFRTGEKKNQKIPTGIIHSSYYPAIISKGEWDDVRAKMLLNPAHVGPGRPKKHFVDLFEGLIKCGYCGGTMGVRNGTTLVCWNARYGGCVNVGWEIRDYEEALFFQVNEAIESRVKELRSPDNREVQKLEQEIALLSSDISNTSKLLIKFPDNEELGQAFSQLNHQRAEKRKQLESFRKEKDEKTENDLAYEMLGEDDQRRDAARHIRKHLEKIEVFTVGDMVAEFKKIRDEYRDKGIIGYPSITRARKVLQWDSTRYFKIHPKTRECFKVFPSKYLKMNYVSSSAPSSDFLQWAKAGHQVNMATDRPDTPVR